MGGILTTFSCRPGPWPQAGKPHAPREKIAILQFRERQIRRVALDFWAELHGRRKLVGQINLWVKGVAQ